MCTVKQDLNIPETTSVVSPLANSVGMISRLPPPPVGLPPKAPNSTADNYDLINRQQSQLLLDMIYATKKPCFFSSKVPCPGTPAAKAVAEKGLAEELAAIKAELAEVKAQLGALPGAILAALKQEQARQMSVVEKEKQLDLVEIESEEENSEDSEDEDLEDFDRLSSSSSSSSVTAASESTAATTKKVLFPLCEKGATSCHSTSSTPRTVSMSSDIEVLSSFHHCSSSGSFAKPACFGSSVNCISPALLNSTSNSASATVPLNFSISKELTALNAKLKAMELPKQASASSAESVNGKAIASSLFSHWADRFASSTAVKSGTPSGTAPTGNIVVVNKSSASSVQKILPYSSAIDVNHWLK